MMCCYSDLQVEEPEGVTGDELYNTDLQTARAPAGRTPEGARQVDHLLASVVGNLDVKRSGRSAADSGAAASVCKT